MFEGYSAIKIVVIMFAVHLENSGHYVYLPSL